MSYLGIDQELFSIKHFQEHFGDQTIDTFIQNPQDPGLDPRQKVYKTSPMHYTYKF